jgi:hypothetical protein
MLLGWFAAGALYYAMLLRPKYVVRFVESGKPSTSESV